MDENTAYPIPDLPSLRPVQPRFSRPMIAVHRDVKREWREIPAGLVRAGDTVAEVGSVSATMSLFTGITLENVLGNSFTFRVDQKVLAFVESE